jgi:hypothetical protein
MMQHDRLGVVKTLKRAFTRFDNGHEEWQ